MTRKSQVSTEYLIVIGFVTFLIVSTLAIGFFYIGQINDKIKINQLQNFANKITSSAESVFYAGEPSKVRISTYLPGGVESIEIDENEDVIRFTIATSSGTNTISFSSNVPISGTISKNEGVKVIIIEAQSNQVFISQE